jgi:hypothetical protein
MPLPEAVVSPFACQNQKDSEQEILNEQSYKILKLPVD